MEAPDSYKRFGSALADYVFHPDYYKGRWKINILGYGSRNTLLPMRGPNIYQEDLDE